MKCPKCGSIKQLTPESKRTEDSVWRRRVCKACHHTWLTEECISTEKKMPTKVWQFTDEVMRQAPKAKNSDSTPKAPDFNTDTLKHFRW